MTFSLRPRTHRLVGAVTLAILSAVASAFDARAHEGFGTGEIRGIDLPARKIIIRHEPLEDFDMPAMTMAYRHRDPALVEGFQAGDAVRFQAKRLGAVFIVTRIELAR